MSFVELLRNCLGPFGRNRQLREQAREVFRKVKPSLLEQIPAGCRLNESACRDSLVAILRKDADGNRAEHRFIKRVQANPYDFINGFAELHAESIFEQLNPTLAASLPLGCRLKKDRCVSTIAAILVKNAVPVDLSGQLAGAIQSAPREYIAGTPAPGTPGFYSSAPQSMSRSATHTKS